MKIPLLVFTACLITGCTQSKTTEQAKPAAAPKVQLGGCLATTPAPKSASGWMERFNALNKNATDFDGQLIFIGDSITQGWEGAGKKVWEEHFAERGALNLGISGDRTQHVLWRLTNGNLDVKPSKAHHRVAVIMIGTNNTGQGNYDPNADTAEQIADGIIAVVQTYRDLVPDSKVLLLGIFPRGETPGEIREKIKSINSKASTVADGKNIVYLDISDKFIASNGYITKTVMPDFLHLSSHGYEIWADSIEPALNDMLR